MLKFILILLVVAGAVWLLTGLKGPANGGVQPEAPSAMLEGRPPFVEAEGLLHVDAEAVPGFIHHHYFREVRPGVRVGLIYDGEGPDATLIGIEYVISPERLEALPDQVKKTYHPHRGEVEEGLLTLPETPQEKKQPILESIATTYGKMIWIPTE